MGDERGFMNVFFYEVIKKLVIFQLRYRHFRKRDLLTCIVNMKGPFCFCSLLLSFFIYLLH